MDHRKRARRCMIFAGGKPAVLVAAVVIFISGCATIWNASDLAVWVRNRAVEQGCQRGTVVLDEWYTRTAEGNVWRGTCRDEGGHAKPFGIPVDSVWTPSAVEAPQTPADTTSGND